MKNQLHPCLWFNGQAKAAAEFYCSVFKNSRILSENPIVVMFELNGKKFMGLNGGPDFTFTPSISFFVTCETIEETNKTWEKLIEGGKALIPIDKQAWSERYGWVEDKFGLSWQISVANAPGDTGSITPSMLFTDHRFGQAEEAIKFYTSLFESSSIAMMMRYPAGDDNEGKVMFSAFTLDHYPMIAMDGRGTHNYTFNEAVSLVVNCDTQGEIDHFWNRLTEGGAESQCGWLKDRFGVSWQIVPSVLGQLMSNPERAQRVMGAVLKMKKLDIAALENA